MFCTKKLLEKWNRNYQKFEFDLGINNNFFTVSSLRAKWNSKLSQNCIKQVMIRELGLS